MKKNRNKEVIKRKIKILFEKIKWDPESFFEASAYEEAQRSGWNDVIKKNQKLFWKKLEKSP